MSNAFSSNNKLMGGQGNDYIVIRGTSAASLNDIHGGEGEDYIEGG